MMLNQIAIKLFWAIIGWNNFVQLSNRYGDIMIIK